MEHVILLWDGPPKNYINVCLESLRLYNKNCIINFFYNNEIIIKEYEKYNINFIKINRKECYNKLQYYKILITNKLCNKLDNNDKILILDCDLLFQNNPFSMFSKFPNNDIYYTHSIMSTKDSLRPNEMWKNIDYKVNGGVWGIIVNDTTKKLMSFWINNLLNKVKWDKWINYKYHKEHGINDLNWWVDQDFLNCIDNNELPFNLKKVNVGYKYNYFVSTWGHFNEYLNMGNKIGNSDYVIIHFKANFKDTYNIENPKIYNMENILAKKDLTTEKSRDNIYKKFMSRGKKRFDIV